MDKVKPRHWVPTSKVGFPNWMYDTFNPEEYSKDDDYSCDATNKKIKLFSHQKIVRDFLQVNSPYRGVLLYHGLGVGKTCASIAAAEDFIDSGRKIIIMLPASLETNYRKDIMNCSRVGLNRRKTWSKVTLDVTKKDAAQLFKRLVGFFRYDEAHVSEQTSSNSVATLWIPFIPKQLSIPESAISTTPFKELTKKDQSQIKKALDSMIKNRYTFISYNGLSKSLIEDMPAKLFNDAFVVIDEAHNFISQATHANTLKYVLYNKLLEAKNSKFILLTGTPVINDPFELAYTLNLIRGPITRYTYKLKKDAEVPTVVDVRTALANEHTSSVKLMSKPYNQFVDYVHVHEDSRKIELTFTPENMVYLDEKLLMLQPWPWGDKKALRQKIHSVITSIFNTEEPAWNSHESALPMDKKTFDEMFINTNTEQPQAKNQDLFMRRITGLVSYFKTTDINIFPEKLDTVIRELPLTDYQFSQYVAYRERERKLSKQAAINPLKETSSVYRAYTRMVGNFVFPSTIIRKFPPDIKVMNKKEIEDIYEATKIKYDTVQEGYSNIKTKIYERELGNLLTTLQDQATHHLTPEKLQTMFSPKMAALLHDLNKSPGKSLIYSQFNMIEGIGVFKIVLEANGWKEIELVSAGKNDWDIKNADEVLSPEFANKRFIAFNPDRDVTNVLMNILNGNMNALPPTARNTLRSKGYVAREDNIKGHWATAILISQSGAEGINLKHIRQVHILEPFWNQVRIDQVIGRAIRTCSHSDLPVDERNVQVFIYVAAFTKEQKQRDMSIATLDQGLTSDQYILMMSLRKNTVINSFLSMLMQSSIDCLNNSKRSKIFKENKLQCYAYPTNQSPSDHGFSPSITFDYSQMDSMFYRLLKSKKVQGRAVLVRGKKYITLDTEERALYDYDAYMNAGVLVQRA
jgi:hypothetical protein